jgi:hypothetical protein
MHLNNNFRTAPCSSGRHYRQIKSIQWGTSSSITSILSVMRTGQLAQTLPSATDRRTQTYTHKRLYTPWSLKRYRCPCAFSNSALRHEGVLGEWRYISTHSLTSALDGGEWSASRPGRFTPSERDPGTHWIGGWVGPRAVLDAVVKRKISSPRRESNPRTPIVQPVA